MANLITTQGLADSARQTYNISGKSATGVKAMAWDTGTGAGFAFLAADTKLNDHGAVTVIAKDPDSTFPSISGLVVTNQGTLAVGDFNGNTIGRISEHLIAAASVTSSSVTLAAGSDQQSIAKNSGFALVTQTTRTFS